MQNAKLESLSQIREFVFAGNATFTVVSRTTGARFTYRVRRSGGAPWFVAVLSGPDNEADFSYLGTAFPGPGDRALYVHGRKSRVNPEAPSAVAAA